MTAIATPLAGLVSNGDFSGGLAGWDHYPATALVLDSASYGLAAPACRATRSTVGSWDEGLWHNLTLAPSTRYRVIFRYLFPAGRRFYANWNAYDSAWSRLGGGDFPLLGAGSWAFHETTFTTPAGAALGDLGFYFYPDDGAIGDAFTIDDVQIYGPGMIPAGALAVSSITVDGTPINLAGVLADVTIRHGRTDYFDDASPSTCNLSLLGVTRAYTKPFRLGRLLVVNATDGATIAPQFTGRFTDARLDGDTLSAIAVGRLRTLSGYTIGLTDYPAETWSARVARAFADAGLSAVLELAVGAFDPQLAARPTAAIALDDYLGDLATMVESAVADRPDGKILVQSLAARSGSGAVKLDPAEIVYAPEWEMRLPPANVVEVRYSGGAVTVQDDASIALYGPIRVSIETTFANAADATAVGNARLARAAYAHWTLPGAELLYGRRLPIGKPVTLSALPPAAPYPSWSPILEGWTDRIVSDGDELVWTMELSLSDPLLSGLTVAWQDVPTDAAHAWNTINQTVAWRDALSLADLDP